MKQLLWVALIATAISAVPAPAQAGLLTFTPLTADQAYQQTTNNPCVIGENSCKNPLGWTQTTLDAGNADSYDATSPGYTVAQIRALFGDAFFMGFDINQATAAGSGIQQLSYFDMQVNTGAGYVVVDSVTFDPAAFFPPTPGGGNGNGYADYLISGFTSLSVYAPTDLIRFRAVLPSVNDGAEQFFVLDVADPPPPPPPPGCPPNCPPPPPPTCPPDCPPPPPPPVPEPATLVMLGVGLLGVGFARRRR